MRSLLGLLLLGKRVRLHVEADNKSEQSDACCEGSRLSDARTQENPQISGVATQQVARVVIQIQDRVKTVNHGAIWFFNTTLVLVYTLGDNVADRAANREKLEFRGYQDLSRNYSTVITFSLAGYPQMQPIPKVEERFEFSFVLRPK